MPPTQLRAEQRSLVVLGPAQLARHSIEEALESAERLAGRTSVTYHGAHVLQAQQAEAQWEAQRELDSHLVQVRSEGGSRGLGGCAEVVAELGVGVQASAC
jgi:hypothetical protein